MWFHLRMKKILWLSIFVGVLLCVGQSVHADVTVDATVPAQDGGGGHNNGGGGGGPAPAPDPDPIPAPPAVCGNGVVEGAETCDDGNNADNDGCSAACRVEPPAVCGNAVQEVGEQCDDGNGNDDDGCNNICRLAICGDGQRQGVEQCDDANLVNNDGCSAVCIVEIPPVCGNGAREGAEQCDDGNDVDRDGCSAQCLIDPAPVCGNQLLEFGEQCDDGNGVNHDGCSAQCVIERPARCGNRLIEFGEQCDDGNFAGGDGCSGVCQNEPAAICGNFVKELGEVCDDGNQNDDDGCNHLCQFVPLPGTVCGNAVREAGEQCDDGNLDGGDGCSGACQGENQNGDPLGNNAQAPDAQNPDQPPVAPLGEDQINPESGNGKSTSSPESVFAPIFSVSKPSTTPLFAGVETDAPLTKKVSVIAQNVAKNIASTAKFFAEETKAVGVFVQEAADNPQVEQATKTVVAPTAAAVVVATVAPSLVSIALPLLRFLFLQPLLLFGRKKREEWGQIYNTLTKLPVDLAMIRLVDPVTKRIVQSRVTDAQGRYLFIVDPGEYLLEVTKPGFSFPSTLLQGVKSDGKLLDIYHGEKIQVTTAGAGLTPNIPLDPIGANKTPRRIVWERRWGVAQHIISVSGIVLTALGIYITPVWYMWVFLGVHIFAYIGFIRFVKPKKPAGWGLVSEKDSSSPLGNTIVRLFTKQYNKLVSTQVTDKGGRYAFLVGPSEYYVTYEKKGYKPHTTESFQITEDTKSSVVKEKVVLEKDA